MEQIFKVKVNDTLQFSINESDINNLNIISLSPTQFHIIHNNKSYNLKLDNFKFIDRTYTLSDNNNNNKYHIKIQNNLDKLIQDIGLSAATSKKSNAIIAPMPGLILNLNIKPGQEVNEGDTLLILVAMKMENTITSPKSGVVKLIHIKTGETVGKGQLMIELE